ncbi:hypothetical protein SS50377_28419 [Spironucleus salmonicida]|uniref:Uncharacterized protein n=1 Tax=Spironucleus salmonicida TaxID=348837 RepID=V6LFZ9_9EUKA|nr:hypothetical protein SS50377_28419 [Spironucleus salmonicida]|eukprot:EST43193.1 Hypothetical protein SS50377_17134 [Spironucleus salmonicida]
MVKLRGVRQSKIEEFTVRALCAQTDFSGKWAAPPGGKIGVCWIAGTKKARYSQGGSSFQCNSRLLVLHYYVIYVISQFLRQIFQRCAESKQGVSERGRRWGGANRVGFEGQEQREEGGFQREPAGLGQQIGSF